MKSLRTAEFLITALLSLSAASCLGSAPPVTIVGAVPDLRALSGTWFGEYSSVLTGRSGTISFELRATDDSAFGSVVMMPKGATGPLRPWQDPRMTKGQVPIELTISFVRITNGQITGALAPYADPASREPLHTTFEGKVTADTIVGTFTTRPGSSSSEGPTGTWSVQRTKRSEPR